MPFLGSGLRLLSSEARSLHGAVYVLASAAVLSSLLALLRDRLFAHTFGAGVELDIYYAAFRIPDLIFVAIGALVSVYILIPELARRSETEQKRYIDTVCIGFSLLAVCGAGAAYVAAPLILATLFPHFAEQGVLPDVVLLARVLLIQPVLLGFSNILAAITQSRHRYALYALSPLLYNIGIIAGILIFYPLFGIVGLAWGVVLGALFHMSIQIPSILRDGFFRSPSRFEPRVFLRTITISVPRALALSVNQVAFIGLTVLAGGLSAGSIAVFMFAYNLQAVPLAVIGASYSVAAFPTLAVAYAAGKRNEFIEQVAGAARHVLFWSLPAMALLIVLRAHIVRTVLGSGAFDWADTRLTAALLASFSISLAAQGIMLLLVRGYYAAGRTFVPLAVSIASGASMVLVGVLLLSAFEDPQRLAFLESALRVGDVPGSSVAALALSYAFASILGAIVLVLHFEYTFGAFFEKIRRTLWQSTLAALLAGGSAYTVLTFMGPLTLSSTLASVFLRGIAGGLVGVFVAALVYRMLGNTEFAENVATIRSKVWRGAKESEVPTVVSSAEDIGHTSPQ